MNVSKSLVAFFIFFTAGSGSALGPDGILIIANRDIPASVRIANYYCAKRKVPHANILALPLGASLSDTIDRGGYEAKLAEPIREKLSAPEFAEKIKCLLTTYGVPTKVGGRGPLKDKENELRRLHELTGRLKSAIQKMEQSDSPGTPDQKKQLQTNLSQLQSQIDRIQGKETNASVDSELSMVLFSGYELYRWQPNQLKNNLLGLSLFTLMVSRLDGPSETIARGLVDKAVKAEKTALKGTAYFDSRGITRDKERSSPGHFDQSLRDLAVLTRFRSDLTVKQEQTEALFPSGACPRTALYCGWYSLQKYVDAFDFVDGAVGFHISSLEAANLRDPNSTQWCPAMLKDGITATLGAAAEPYLYSFPEPRAFFLELFKGRCLVEAYYYTKPFNSWQLILIGDPLYTPFKRTR
ncbi:MAG: TIGR03790 family protein [Planctomycetota bacterium]